MVLVNYVSYDPSRWCADSAGRQEFCSPGNFVACVSKLYRNRGADGEGRVTLEDATITSGLGAAPAPGLGVLCADFDGDNWVDIFVANDRTPNHLWINQRDGTFKDEATTRGVAYNCMGRSEADMGTAIGDVNGNGLFDMFVPHLTTETHTFWSQETRGVFYDRTAMSGVTAAKWRSTGFGTFADMENDGDLDLVICTGRVYRNAGVLPKTRPDLDKLWAYYAEADQLLLNNGQGRFTDVSGSEPALSAVATVSRGLACGDIDNDGGVDVLIAHTAGPPSLLRMRRLRAATGCGCGRSIRPCAATCTARKSGCRRVRNFWWLDQSGLEFSQQLRRAGTFRPGKDRSSGYDRSPLAGRFAGDIFLWSRRSADDAAPRRRYGGAVVPAAVQRCRRAAACCFV